MVSIVLQILYLALLLFIYTLFARFVMGTVMTFGRRWRPGRGAAAVLEVVWSVTDPPLKALRRVIPPLRLGAISLDLAALVVLFGVWLLLFVLDILIHVAEGL